MKIYATVIKDSVNPRGDRITTAEVCLPHIILPQFNKYGMIASSASSARAIPVQRKIDEVMESPFIPKRWGKNQAGMVAREELSYEKQLEAESVWLEARNAAVDYATYLRDIKLHKQLVTRLLEPWLYQTVVFTTTQKGIENLFSQRIDDDAQEEFQELAIKTKEAYLSSTPQELDYGDWHLPFIDPDEENLDLSIKKKISVARTARTSYGNQDKRDIDKDIQLHDSVFSDKHLAPFEMVAQAVDKGYKETMGRYSGWEALRHLINFS